MLCEPHLPPSMHEYPVSMIKFIWFGEKRTKEKKRPTHAKIYINGGTFTIVVCFYESSLSTRC